MPSPRIPRPLFDLNEAPKEDDHQSHMTLFPDLDLTLNLNLSNVNPNVQADSHLGMDVLNI